MVSPTVAQGLFARCRRHIHRTECWAGYEASKSVCEVSAPWSMFGANQGSGERNDEEAVAALEGSSLYRGTGPTMPALISTALQNLCTCKSIKKSSAPSEK